MAHDVLISYSTKDKPQADAICNQLESQGIRCWIAPRDVPLGTEYADSIVQAIESAKVMVLVFSAHANESHQVRREVERAVSKGLTIVPVRIEDTKMNKSFELYVSSMHWLDAITPPLAAHIDKLAIDLKRLLSKGNMTSADAPEHSNPLPAEPHERPIRSKRRSGWMVRGAIVALTMVIFVASYWAFLGRGGATIVSGNNQSVPRTGLDIPGGEAEFAPLIVNIRSSSGTPLAGVPVEFRKTTAPSEMAVQIDPSGKPSMIVNTDANGNATLDKMGGASIVAYYAEGPITIETNIKDEPKLFFSLTVAPSPPPTSYADAVVTIVSGNDQSVPRTGLDIPGGRAEFEPLVVKLSSSSGSPLVGAQVEFRKTSAPRQMVVQMEPSGASPSIVLTDADGVARLDKMSGSGIYAYYADGVAVVSALHSSAKADFTLTVPPHKGQL